MLSIFTWTLNANLGCENDLLHIQECALVEGIYKCTVHQPSILYQFPKTKKNTLNNVVECVNNLFQGYLKHLLSSLLWFKIFVRHQSIQSSLIQETCKALWIKSHVEKIHNSKFHAWVWHSMLLGHLCNHSFTDIHICNRPMIGVETINSCLFGFLEEISLYLKPALYKSALRVELPQPPTKMLSFAFMYLCKTAQSWW